MGVIAYFAASCSGGSSASENVLRSGQHMIAFPEYLDNSCWSVPWPPAFEACRSVVSSDGRLAIDMPGLPVLISPDLSGAVFDEKMHASGFDVIVFSSSCSVGISGALSGELTGDDEGELELEVHYDGTALNESFPPSDCGALEGQMMFGAFPFPTLSNPANGSCSLRAVGSIFEAPGCP